MVKTKSKDVIGIKKWTEKGNCVWYIRCNGDSYEFHFECRAHQKNDTIVTKMEKGPDQIKLYVVPCQSGHNSNFSAWRLDEPFRVDNGIERTFAFNMTRSTTGLQTTNLSTQQINDIFVRSFVSSNTNKLETKRNHEIFVIIANNIERVRHSIAMTTPNEKTKRRTKTIKKR